MGRLIMCIFFMFAVYVSVDGVRECYKCSGEDCALTDTTIQRPCPHINNICYTVVEPKSCKVFEKGCGVTTMCDVYSNCVSCDTDLCNAEVNFQCNDPCAK